ncbi:MAG: hypothetical protein KDI79_03865, partial [Anaerolineae bacterium]|nr:hypothetical protein [Anaerolineae bacterium]
MYCNNYHKNLVFKDKWKFTKGALSLIAVLIGLIYLADGVSAGPPVDEYADSVGGSSGIVVFANNATGSPDGNFAAVAGLLGGGDLTLDMGQGEEGTGNLIVYYQVLETGVMPHINFLDEDRNVIASTTLSGLMISPGTLAVTATYPNSPTRYRYVQFISDITEVFLIDAIEAVTFSPDDDGDGILNSDEDRNHDGNFDNDDTDGDTIPNYQDTDDDGDGIDTATECPSNPCTDSDGDTVPNYLEPNNVDTDTDSAMNHADNDDDGDTILTADEDINGNGDPTDDDLDGDGKPNYLDDDDDGDGTLTKDEGTGDSDGDGIPNYLDPNSGGDSDSDGIIDGDEDPNGDNNPLNDDTDGDGTPNYLD